MHLATGISQGQAEARARWGTQESGAVFDRKKRPFLSEEAREFIAQQAMAVLVGPGQEREPQALLLASRPGFVETPDMYTCLIPVERRYETSPLLQGIQTFLQSGAYPRLALCLVQHVTRQRICVQGVVEMSTDYSPDVLWLYLHVTRSFFHCPKYVRTRINGLHIPGEHRSAPLNTQEHNRLSEDTCAFMARQTLCYLCTLDSEGQYAVNHRGGAAGFLVTLEPDRLIPGGVVLLPDYAGNGAFEAVGNILETGQAALLVPGYAEQAALCATGTAAILEPGQLPAFLREQCKGAQRIVALTVKQASWQEGDWSAALAYEQRRAQALAEAKEAAPSCAL